MDFRSSLTSEVAVEELETQREQIEVLRSRLDLLAGRDRALLALYLESGSSLSQMARLTGMQPSSIGRRVRRIIERLRDETYVLCLNRRAGFSALELAIIKDHFVRGLSLRRISRNRNLGYYRVRAAAAKARHLAAAQNCGLRPRIGVRGDIIGDDGLKKAAEVNPQPEAPVAQGVCEAADHDNL